MEERLGEVHGVGQDKRSDVGELGAGREISGEGFGSPVGRDRLGHMVDETVGELSLVQGGEPDLCGVPLAASGLAGCTDIQIYNSGSPVGELSLVIPLEVVVSPSIKESCEAARERVVLALSSGSLLGGQEVGECSFELVLEPHSLATEAGTSTKPLAVSFPSNALEGESPAWVLDMVSSVGHMVGLSCGGQEEKLRDLFATLERDWVQLSSKKSRKSKGKMLRELQGLKSSVNYEGSSSIARKTKSYGLDC